MDNIGWNRWAIVLIGGFALSACGGDDDGKTGSKNSIGRFGSLPRLGMSSNMAGMKAMMPTMSGRMCSAPANPTACEACVIGKCRGPCNACAADSSCPAALQCAGECDDDACIEDCGEPAAINKVVAFAQCIQDSCSSQCGAVQSSGDSACDACAQAQCKRLSDACSREPDCLALAKCCTEGSDAECEECIDAAPSSAVMTLTQVGQCLTECGCD